MLIKDCIYCIGILFSLLSIPALKYTIKNKDRNFCKRIIVFDVVAIVYFIVLFYAPNILCVEIGLEILFIYLFELIATVLYIISIISNLIKIRNLQINPQAHSNHKKSTIVVSVLLILPALFFSTNILKDKFLINNSELVLVYRSAGNGGFGDSDTFAYAIGKNVTGKHYCVQFDLGTAVNGYNLKDFLPENAVEIKDINNIEDYKITFNTSLSDNSISVYKNNKFICKTKHKEHYFNIDFERGFYVNND